jgi:DNA-binding winged helix-turn-helix (wHTH) protein
MRASGMNVAYADSHAPTPSSSQFQSEPTDDAKAQGEYADRTAFSSRDASSGSPTTQVCFGPFRLLPGQFLLLEDEKPVPLGSRALEILIALLERPGKLISKQELMRRVWPHVFVEPANLTVHISALRRTLRDGRDGTRYIINVPGRGYSFVACVTAAMQSTQHTSGNGLLSQAGARQ